MIASHTPAPRGSLTADRIVNAALDFTRGHGAPALSMRRLAAELGVEAMSLYHHVPNKTTLITLMANRSLSQVRAPDPEKEWDQQLLQLLLELYQTGVDNPTVIQALATELPPSEAANYHSAAGKIVGQVIQLLQQSPLPAPQRQCAAHGLIKLLLGAIVAQVPTPTPPAARTPNTEPPQPPTTDLKPHPTAAALQRMQKDAVTDLQLSIRWFLLGITTQPARNEP